MIGKYFFCDYCIGLTPKAYDYANEKRKHGLRIYHYTDGDTNETGYGLEFRGYDLHFMDVKTLSGYLENLAFIES